MFHATLVTVLILMGHCNGLDITYEVFGVSTDILPVAFGDMNSDKLVDLFAVDRGHNLLKILFAVQDETIIGPSMNNQYFQERENSSCRFPGQVIKNVIPADFTSDGALDVLVVLQGQMDTPGSPYQIFLLLGNINTLSCDKQHVADSSKEPFLLDYNGDMVPDLLYESVNETGVLYMWLSSGKAHIETLFSNQSSSLRVPHSSAFVDINHDLMPDLVLDVDGGFKVYTGSLTGLDSPILIPHPPGLVVGQSIFLDIDLNYGIDHLVGTCSDNACHQVALYVYRNNKWIALDVNFHAEESTTWGFPVNQDPFYLSTITFRTGDFNLDGYPDLIVTLKDGDKIRVVLLKNIACNYCEFHRTFEVDSEIFQEFGKTVMGTFFDIDEDGTLEVLLVKKAKNSEDLQSAAYRSSTNFDANFIKVMVTTGLCFTDCTNENLHGKLVPYGTNQVGATICYKTVRPNSDLQSACAPQLPQTAHLPLALPYTVFGLGRTPNFVEQLDVGISPSNGLNLTRSWTQIIPNSRMVIIPYPLDDPGHWINKLFLTLSHSLLQTLWALLGTFFVNLVIVGALHLRERKLDKLEKRTESHKFNFEAM